jgi:hypothetical protein
MVNDMNIIPPRMWARKRSHHNMWDILHLRPEWKEGDQRPYFTTHHIWWARNDWVELEHYDHFVVWPGDLKDVS